MTASLVLHNTGPTAVATRRTAGAVDTPSSPLELLALLHELCVCTETTIARLLARVSLLELSIPRDFPAYASSRSGVNETEASRAGPVWATDKSPDTHIVSNALQIPARASLRSDPSARGEIVARFLYACAQSDSTHGHASTSLERFQAADPEGIESTQSGIVAQTNQSVAPNSWQLPPALAPAPIHSYVSTSLPRSNESPSSESTDVRTVHPPLCNDANASNGPNPPPFVLAELKDRSDPLGSTFMYQLCVQVASMLRTLPNDGLDAQTQVVQRIIEYIRAHGAKSSCYFNDKSVEDLRTILQRDEAFSEAVRTVFGDNLLAAGQSILFIARHGTY
ncbi:hypothetical protein AURDEDRAFT_175082 [Auricularia subglabra TFB-10046 SS5]|uniref:Uncharacterized protein n=1 Tax=Auricularia subglabra (strain TFB-10046 / SS5) TaxID=717982 RepID=J0WTK9_AURST|nr:hypothetical protein AURDEDRAFT_175082 [Auricularia subglabra TFB-10046 SS5]